MANALRDAVEAEREAQMKPLLPWCTAEPAISLPLSAVLIDKKHERAYVTLKSISEAVETETKPL